jgi:hypothetical protein
VINKNKYQIIIVIIGRKKKCNLLSDVNSIGVILGKFAKMFLQKIIIKCVRGI